MNLAILSRNPSLYSTRRLVAAAKDRGHDVRVLDHLKCHLLLNTAQSGILYEGEPITGIDAIIPRIGASVSFFGLSVIRQFETMGIHTAIRSAALARSRNKFQALQLMAQHQIPVPATAFANFTQDIPTLIDQVGGAPVILKLMEGTHGLGVVLAETEEMAVSLIETWYKLKARFIVQEYIAEASGTDLRALVVNGKVVAAMERTAKSGDFRSNLHRGGSGQVITLSPAEEQTALQAAAVMDLSVAGVDMLRSKKGPLVLEVNPSPGLEGIETVTQVDIAGHIIDYLEGLTALTPHTL